MLIKRISLLTGNENTRDIPITIQQFLLLNDDKPVGNVCNNLSPEDREFLITGITQQEWEDKLGGPINYHDNGEIAGIL